MCNEWNWCDAYNQEGLAGPRRGNTALNTFSDSAAARYYVLHSKGQILDSGITR